MDRESPEGLRQREQAMQDGTPFDTVCQRERIWGKKKNLIRNAAQRIPANNLKRMLSRCLEVDQQIKGAPGDPWLSLTGIILQLAGVKLSLQED